MAIRGCAALAGACLAAAALFACGDGSSSAPADPPGPADHLALNRAWLSGTHNSYWVDRGIAADVFASGVQQSLLDQLLADKARAIEIDVHPDVDRPRRFRVYHTVPGNTLCDDLADCLRPLRLLHAALPRHEPVHVIVELKRFTGPNFDPEHTVDDLEAAFEESLGPWLFRPRDLLAACDPEGSDPDPDLLACLARVGWPTIASLRGRFLVSVLGNFDDLIPQAKGTLDWAQFTLHGDLRERTAFSMASSWKLDWDALPEKIRIELSREDLERARRRAAYLQVEDPADPNLLPFLAGNGLVRIGGAFDLEAQRERVALGAQILQGDTPWIQIEDRGPAQPLRPLDDAEGEIVEPGERLELAAGPDGDAFASKEVRARSSARWETLPSVGGESDAIPCLAAATGASEVSTSSVALCRTKLRAERAPGAPLGSGEPDTEKLRLRLRICRDGACDWLDLATTARMEIAVAISLRVDPSGAGSCASAWAAEDVGVGGLSGGRDDGAGGDDSASWTPLGEPACFSRPLRAQGRLALGGASPGSVLFAGTRLRVDGRAVAGSL